MSKTLRLSQLVREETKTITISIPASQYRIMEQLAAATNRPINDVASELFRDHTIPPIDAMLNPKPDESKKKTNPQKVAGNQPSLQTQTPLPGVATSPVSPSPVPATRITNQAPPSQTPVSGFGSAPAQTPMQRPPQSPTQSQQPQRPYIPPSSPTTHPENE